MTQKRSLQQMNPQHRFSSRAEDYAKYRPSYPSGAIDCVLQLDPTHSLVADIGAGTGISSRLLADRGIRVIAIEPNAAMIKMAAAHPGVAFQVASAENTGLADNSIDLVTCFQAFHWFEPEPTLKEFTRILKPQGKLAVVWNNRNQEDEFTCEYSNLIKLVSNHNSQWRVGREKFLTHSTWFNQVNHRVFPYHQALNREGLIGRSMSTSYIPKQGKEAQKLVRNLNQIHQQYCDQQGLVYLKYKTSVYWTNID